MGQRKKGNKFFRWMRMSDLPDCDKNRSLLLDVSKKVEATRKLSPKPVRPYTSYIPSAFNQQHTNAAINVTSNEVTFIATDAADACAATEAVATESLNHLNRTPIHHRHSVSGSCSTTVTVRELTGHFCYTANNLKIGQSSPKLCSNPDATDRTTHRHSIGSNSNKSTNESGRVVAAINVNSNQLPAAQRVQFRHNASVCKGDDNAHLTHCSAVANAHSVNSTPVSRKTNRSSTSTAVITDVGIEVAAAAAATEPPRKWCEKSLSCRLYDCMPIGACTARNESCEPPDTQQPSVASKLDLDLRKNSISRSTQLSKRRFLQSIMDRSMDSIGSCSLDVDAVSTDFSDTSGSLNLCTPLSGKDFTREFTSRIHERCQIGQITCQKATTVLDPTSGKISTILSTTSNATNNTYDCVPSSPAKKPSYLNLACCVNGYSNLTTYDSKLRQNINKSREVSPIRPITHTLQYNRGEGGQYLVVPISVPVTTVNTAATATINDMDSRSQTTLISPDKRHFSISNSSSKTSTNDMSAAHGKDVTDNIAAYYKSPTLQRDHQATLDAETNSPKSFIQQRVERLYGPGALAQGFYSPKRCNSDTASILSERSQNSTNTVHTKIFKSEYRNGLAAAVSAPVVPVSAVAGATELENVQFMSQQLHQQQQQQQPVDEKSLPVFRHLRPEFRAQLPIVSPKRTMAKTDFGLVAHSKLASPQQVSKAASAVAAHQQLNGRQYNGNSNGVTTNIISTTTTTISSNTLTHSYMKATTQQQQQQQQHVVVVSNGLRSLKPQLSKTMNNGCVVSEDDKQAFVDECVHKMKICDDSVSLGGGEKNSVLATTVAVTTNGQPVQVIIADVAASDLPVPIVLAASNGVLSNGNHHCQQELIVNGGAASTGALSSATTSSIKDGLYFLEILRTERDRLIALAVTAEGYMDNLTEGPETDEEIFGHLRSAAGKARLLATQKIRQFEGLCHNSLNQMPGEKFPTTPQDLQGFWDMVMLQVDNVDSLFKDIETYRANNWKKLPTEKHGPPTGSRLTKRPMASRPGTVSTAKSAAAVKANGTTASEKKSAVALAAAQRREAQRKQLLELKRKNRQAVASTEPAPVDILVPASNGVEMYANEASS